jgi:hypothetical protein
MAFPARAIPGVSGFPGKSAQRFPLGIAAEQTDRAVRRFLETVKCSNAIGPARCTGRHLKIQPSLQPMMPIAR